MPNVRYDVNDAELRQAFLARLLNEALVPLRADAAARWGRMTAQQMVEHLIWSFELSTGRFGVECSTPAEQLPRARGFLQKNRPMPRDFMNPLLVAGLPPLRHASLEEAKRALGVEVERFREQERGTPAASFVHPVFGSLGNEEWSRSHFKHGVHHLLQFGLVETDEPPGA
jgi:hypothetical protein